MVGIVAGTHWHAGAVGGVLLAALTAAALLLHRHAKIQTAAIFAAVAIVGLLLINRQQHRHALFISQCQRPFKAIVTSAPMEKPHTVAVDLLTTDGQWPLRCYIYNKVEARRLHIGDALLVEAPVEAAEHGGFDRCMAKNRQWRKVGVEAGELPLLLRSRLWFLHQREWVLERYHATGAANDAYALLAAMTLGDKSQLTTELRTAYAGTGAAHVLALSGLHLGIVCSLLLLFLRRRRGRVVAQGIMILAIWAFAFLVGLPTSVIRAATMLSVYGLLSMGRRRGLSVNVLAFAAIVMLVVSPQSLFDVGFQLSFAAVFAILALMPLWDSWVSPQWQQRHRLLSWLWSLFIISVSAQLGTAPLAAYYFGQFPVCFLLTNLVVVPAVWLILHGALLMLLLPAVAPAVTGLASGLNTAMEWLALQPWASIDGLHPSVLQVVLAYVAIAAVVMTLMRWERLT